MELAQKVQSLEQQLKKQGRLLKVMTSLLILTIGTLFFHWILNRQGRLDLQGKTLLVRSSFESNMVFSSALLPYRLDLESRRADLPNAALFEDRSHLGLGKASFARLFAAPSGLGLRLRAENTPPELADVDLFVSEERRGLHIRDAKQRVRIWLELDKNGPRLNLLGEKGEILFHAP